MKRSIIIVLDSAGIGEMPDAEEFGDSGANTLGHIAENFEGFCLPNMEKMGLGNIAHLKGVPPSLAPSGAYGKLAEASRGKDTTVGHWEIAGLVSSVPFPVYPNGFPHDLVESFEKKIGRKTLGNYAASGTDIIRDLGEKHIKTGYPIIYTSADSVFQIAAHEDIIPLEELYEICRKARELLTGKHGVARVIARPFVGEPGHFTRTAHRHDFSFLPPNDTLLDVLTRKGLKTYGIGKIYDIFAGKGISKTISIKDNQDGVDKTIAALKDADFSLIFVNLVDFDMKFGHRRDIPGYAQALMSFDKCIPEILSSLHQEDILFITADHGCDPSFTKHTDHTREYIPLLVNGPVVKSGINLGIRNSFADIGQTAAEYLGIPKLSAGTSFLTEIIKS